MNLGTSAKIGSNNPTEAGLLTRFMEGAKHLFWGIKMVLSTPALFVISAAVIAINFVVYAVLIGTAYAFRHSVSTFIAELLPWLFRWDWMTTAFEVFMLIAWALLSIFFATAIASILAGPLLDILSEKTEKILTGHVDPAPFSVGALVGEIWITLKLMFKSMGLGLLALIFVGWIPVVGQVVPFVIASAFVALNFTTPTLTRHGLGSKERFEMLRNNKAMVIGFGALANIPILSFLLIPLLTPALVVGGTKLFLLLATNKRVPSKVNSTQIATFTGQAEDAIV